MTSLSQGLWQMLSIGKLVFNSIVALTWWAMSSAAAQTPESRLHAEILADLRAARAEAPLMAPQSSEGAAVSAMEAYEELFPLCNSERASDYYARFGRLHGLDGPVDLDQLAEQIFERRNRVGFWQETRWPASDAVGYDVVSRAALDWAIGEWLGQSYLFRETMIEPSESAALALVFRTWCRVRMQNERVLSQFIANHGFPSEASFGSQVESTALYILKHSDENSPLVSRYERAARSAHARRELSDANYAFLLDTLAVFRGQRQPIGSYYNCEGAQAMYDPPLENQRRAERLRRRYGLRTIEQDLAATSRETCAQPANSQPAN